MPAAAVVLEYVEPDSLAPEFFAAKGFHQSDRALSGARVLARDDDAPEFDAGAVVFERENEKPGEFVAIAYREVNDIRCSE